jgi:hypothetical protein
MENAQCARSAGQTQRFWPAAMSLIVRCAN